MLDRTALSQVIFLGEVDWVSEGMYFIYWKPHILHSMVFVYTLVLISFPFSHPAGRSLCHV